MPLPCSVFTVSFWGICSFIGAKFKLLIYFVKNCKKKLNARTLLCQTHLFALKESFSVTVGNVQRQSHYTRSILHPLNDPIQFSPAWTLWKTQTKPSLEATLNSSWVRCTARSVCEVWGGYKEAAKVGVSFIHTRKCRNQRCSHSTQYFKEWTNVYYLQIQAHACRWTEGSSLWWSQSCAACPVFSSAPWAMPGLFYCSQCL